MERENLGLDDRIRQQFEKFGFLIKEAVRQRDPSKVRPSTADL